MTQVDVATRAVVERSGVLPASLLGLFAGAYCAMRALRSENFRS